MTRDRLSDLVSDQQRRCRGGDMMLVEAYLEAHPWLVDDAEAVVELLLRELLLRRECGEPVTAAEYCRRFPQHAERLQRQLALHQALQSGTVSGPGETPHAAMDEGRGEERRWPALPGYELIEELKCLHKDARGRYASAAELADDLRRFAAHEPIRARPASLGERGWKWVHRHPTAAALWLVAVASLAVLLGVWAGFTRELQTEKQRVEQKRIEAVKNYRLARAAVDKFLSEMADDDDLVNEGLAPMRKRLLEYALEFYRKFVQDSSDDPELQLDLADAHERLGGICQLGFSMQEAEEHLQRAQQLYVALSQQPDLPDQRGNLARVQMHLGVVLRQTGRHAEGEQSLLGAAAQLAELLRQRPGDVSCRRGLGACYLQLGWLYNSADAWDKAEPAYETGKRILEELLQEGKAGRHERRFLGPGVLDHQLSLRNAVRALLAYQKQAGQLKESEAVLRRLLADHDALSQALHADPPFAWHLATLQSLLIDVLLQQNQHTEAQAWHERAVRTLQPALDKQHPQADSLARTLRDLHQRIRKQTTAAQAG